MRLKDICFDGIYRYFSISYYNQTGKQFLFHKKYRNIYLIYTYVFLSNRSQNYIIMNQIISKGANLVGKSMPVLIVVILFSFALIAGCTTSKYVSNLEPPLDVIDSNFGLKPFSYPDDWQVVGIEEVYRQTQPVNIHNPTYEEKPHIINIYFGLPAEENTFDINSFNEGRKDRRLKLAYSVVERFGTLSIKKFDEAVQDLADGLNGLPTTEEFLIETKINDHQVFYHLEAQDESPWFYIWFSEDKRYRYQFIFDSEHHSHLRRRPLEEGIAILEIFLKSD